MCATSTSISYCVTGHKLYGPTGIGALYAERTHLASMRPFNGGGEMIAEVSRERVTYADPPARFEAGTPAIIESVGVHRGARLSLGLRSRGGEGA